LDRNRDGVVTRAEWRGNDTSFRNQDRNRDGVISGAELNEGSTSIVPIWWGYDSDRDGRVSRANGRASTPISMCWTEMMTAG
ncbi:MAG: hypothetical protein M3Q55_03845, partial [Acidobacteriota bacterium]|nr:hypothetical protein [Acidobacteriota bacterium]